VAAKVAIAANKISVQARNRLKTFWQSWARTRPDPKSPV